MGKFFYLTRRSTPAYAENSIRPARRRQVRWWCITSVAALVVVCALYLVQANNLAMRGYQIETLRQQIEKLRVESRDLESQALQLQSYQRLNSRLSDLHMVPARDVWYLSAEAGVVSRR